MWKAEIAPTADKWGANIQPTHAVAMSNQTAPTASKGSKTKRHSRDRKKQQPQENGTEASAARPSGPQCASTQHRSRRRQQKSGSTSSNQVSAEVLATLREVLADSHSDRQLCQLWERSGMSIEIAVDMALTGWPDEPEAAQEEPLWSEDAAQAERDARGMCRHWLNGQCSRYDCEFSHQVMA